jgi:holo-[acyl-carrier protein] synthase
MICGIGIDIQDVGAFAECVAQSGNDYIKRVFTEREIAYCDAASNSMEAYAARFAAKEAAMKALGTGWDGVNWHDFEILKEATGPPILLLSGSAESIANERGVVSSWLSLSHVTDYAVAQVVFETTATR